MSVPEWVFDAVFYQIFPDRFANGDLRNDPPNIQAWNSQPELHSFYGGDLRGIAEKLDHLADLGVNALYLNPIFLAPSPHRYNTTDYFTIDDKLGTMADFRALLEAAHARGIRVILDGVFNHTGRGFFAFADILENQEHSPYQDWYHIHHFPVDAYTPDELKDYVGWWGIKSLPKLNTDSPVVREYLLRVARYWMEQGADGWRLDVPNEIDDDAFWAEFRQVVRETNAQAYLLGEIWEASPRWVSEGHFDGLMNYPLREGVIALLNGEIQVSQFRTRMEDLLAQYSLEQALAMYNPLGTHDTARIYTVLDGQIALLQLAYLIQFAFPGAPAIYYGDEIGLAGGKDPDCRRTFPWDPQRWKTDILEWVQQLTAARKAIPALRRGEFASLFVDDAAGVYAFSRQTPDDLAVAVIHARAEVQEILLPLKGTWTPGQKVRDWMSGAEVQVEADGLRLSLQPYQGMLLHAVD